MYKGKKVLVVIPARGGSKGIKHKNVTLLHNRPLIWYSISRALECMYIDKVVVSTDDEEIARISVECGAEVPFLRPKELASDTSKTIDTLVHAVHYYKSKGEIYDYVLLLQPTQPFRLPEHIEDIIVKTIDNNYASMVSVSEVLEHPILMRQINQDGQLVPIMMQGESKSTVRRQDFNKVYIVNGSLYINRIDEKFNSEISLNDNCYPLIMDKRYDIDIDDMEDLERAERDMDFTSFGL